MIDLIFKAGGDAVSVRIINKNIFFMQVKAGIPTYNDLSKIKLPVEGILKKFPELNGLPDSEIRIEGAKRLKEYILNMKTEEEVKNYVITELESIGCILLAIMRKGHRPIFIRRKE